MFGESLVETMSSEAREQYEQSRKEQIEQNEIERIATAPAKGRELAPQYRDSYEVGEITSFEEAKQAADETYMQYWYDRANEFSKNWTDEDYVLIAEPKYEKFCPNGGNICRVKHTRRVVPEGYNQYVEAQKRIEQGPLDFSKKETHYELIKPPTLKAGTRYSKHQYWINETNPLRQALEAQADVMTDYLEENDIPLFVEFPEGTRQEGMRGEGVYLNTGTAAHIDWDDGSLVRMEKYLSSPDSEMGSYSHVRYRPPSEGFGKPLSILGAFTGNPWIAAAGTIASGGDIEDVITNVATGAVLNTLPPVLEDSFASLGIDADLLGMDALEFSDRMMDVQNDIVLGESGTDALVDNFGMAAVGAVADNIDIDIDLPESELLSDLGDAIEPIVNVVKAGADVVQEVTEPVIDVIDEGLDVFGEEVVDPVLQTVKTTGEAIIDPIDDALDTFGSEVVDPTLQAIGEAGQDIIDPIDDIIDAIDSPLGDLLGLGGNLFGNLFGNLLGGMPNQQPVARRVPTQTENIFDKELFKFDTKVKSTKEMLSPTMNLRRYG